MPGNITDEEKLPKIPNLDVSQDSFCKFRIFSGFSDFENSWKVEILPEAASKLHWNAAEIAQRNQGFCHFYKF